MNRRLTVAFILTAVLLFSFASPASALYQWVDEKGHLHITDNPPPSKQSREEPVMPRAPEAPQPAPAPEARPVVPAAVPQASVPAPAPAQVKSIPPAAPPSAPQAAVSPPQAVPVPAPAAPPAPAPAMPAMREAPQANIPSPLRPGNVPPPDFVNAMVAGFMTTFLLISAGMYIFFSLCLYLIAKKLNVAEAWAAWIPLIQVWPFLSSAGKPCWWVILLFIPLVNIFIGVHLWMCIAENLGRNKWLGLLMLLPIVNFVFIGVLAFSKEETAQQAAPA